MKSTIREDQGLTLASFTSFILETQHQPAWRYEALREKAFEAGNQLDSERLKTLKNRGVPPEIENLIGGVMQSVYGQEAKQRTNWRVIADGTGREDADVSDALNEKLNQAEKRSRADRSCSDAFESQAGVGVGFVYVRRVDNKFEYPYKCSYVSFSDCWWDWFAMDKDPMLDNARYFIRQSWVKREELLASYPKDTHPEINEKIRMAFGTNLTTFIEGDAMPDLARSEATELNWGTDKQLWMSVERNEILVYEVWYRVWEEVTAIKLQNGSVEEYDKLNPLHLKALNSGSELIKTPSSRVRVSMWAGLHKLSDDESPYTHNHFPYVPFWGYKEHKTNIPYGRIRSMMHSQEMVNIFNSLVLYSLVSRRSIRTAGAFIGTDEQFRQAASRPDSDFVLNREEMAKAGARFEFDNNSNLNQQHYQALQDARTAVVRAGGISNEYQGVQNNSTSGSQEQTRIEQSQQNIANLMDNFNESRARVGELLLGMIVQDTQEYEEVFVSGGLVKDDRTVLLNYKTIDHDGDVGVELLTNDVQNVMLKVALDDVPTSSSFRVQQLTTLGEAYKSAPPEYQRIMMPHMMALMDMPNKKEIIDAIKKADEQTSPEQQQQQAEMEYKNKELELRHRELDIKERVANQTIENMIADKVKVLVDAQFAAYGVGQQVMMSPIVAPVADSVLENAGYQAPTPKGSYPDLNIPAQSQQPIQAMPVTTNTSPQFPPRPQGDEAPAPQEVQQQDMMMPSAETGIETINPMD